MSKVHLNLLSNLYVPSYTTNVKSQSRKELFTLRRVSISTDLRLSVVQPILSVSTDLNLSDTQPILSTNTDLRVKLSFIQPILSTIHHICI